MTTKFSEFADGVTTRATDIIASLRGGVNTKSTMTAGIQDTSGNYLVGWESGGALATNYLKITSGVSLGPVLLEAVGTDNNIELQLHSKGIEDIILDAGDSGDVQVVSTGALGLASGTTVQRPALPFGGYIRYNSDLDMVEFYNDNTLLWVTLSTGAGVGDVAGPAGATNNSVSLFSGATGKIIKESVVIINAGAITGVASLAIDNLFLDGNTISSTAGGVSIVPLAGQDLNLTTSVGGEVLINGVNTANNVLGPAVATDNAIARYDLGTGKLIQDSSVLISDVDAITGVTALTVDNMFFNGNSITSTAGALNITPLSGQNLNVVVDAGGEFDITGTINITHTATASDDHAIEMIVDAAGFGDVKGISLDYVTGAIAAGEEAASILVNIDETASTGGRVAALQVLTTDEGVADIFGMSAFVNVCPVLQSSGTFGNMDSALNIAVDVLAALSSGGAGNITVFVADNDTVTIGDAAKFEEMQIILGTGSSGAGISPIYEYSTAVGVWSVFSPVDGTNSWRNTGSIAWLVGDIPGWLVGTGGEFLIRITRQRNVLATTPVVDEIQIAATTEYLWDTAGNLNVRSLDIDASNAYSVAGTAILSDAAGTMTLSNVDAFDATTAATASAVNFAADAEASDTYVIALSPALGAYVVGKEISFTANTANTGACTIDVNGLGPIALKKLHDQDPANGDIESGSVVNAVYDGTNFQIVSQIATTPGGGTVTSVTGTANEIDSTGGATPVLSLSATAVAPGTLGITTITASRAVVTDGAKLLTSSATTSVEIGYVNGVTSAIQTQIDGKISQDGSEIFAADAEASDTYVITLAPVPAGYVTGMVVSFSATTLNTGGATINLNTLGAIAIEKQGTALETGDILAGQMVTLIYDGTAFQMISQLALSANSTSTNVFTNKTFDANAAGNSLSNVDVADLADGTAGELITYDAAGAPATVAVGTAAQVLTSNGVGAAPTFQAAGGGAGNISGWINMDGTGTIAITDSYNVSGIVDNGTGNYTITWDTDFANVGYCFVGTTTQASVSNDEGLVSIYPTGALAVGSSVFTTVDVNNASTEIDYDIVCCMAIGDQ